MSLPWSQIDMDFMNLNQAAHGDREFGYLETRMGVARKIVMGHATDPAVAERIGAWARAAAGWRTARSLRLARFGDNMRDVAVTEGDKVEAQLRFGFSVNTYGVNDLVAAVDAAADKEVDALVAEYDETLRGRPRAAARRRAARVAAVRGPDRARPARTSSTTAASPRSPPTSRTSAGCGSCPGWPCSG